MPKYTFGSEVIVAATRREAVREYNRRHYSDNQKKLDELGIEIDPTGQTRAAPTIVTPGPIRKVNIPTHLLSKKEQRAQQAAATLEAGGAPAAAKPKKTGGAGKTKSPGWLDNKARQQATLGASGAPITTFDPNDPLKGKGSSSGKISSKAIAAMMLTRGDSGSEIQGGIKTPTHPGFGMLQAKDQPTFTDSNSLLPNIDPAYQAVVQSPDTFVSVQSALLDFAKATPDVVRFWQKTLGDSGFLGFASDGSVKTDVLDGIVDEPTLKAFNDFLLYSLNRGGVTDSAFEMNKGTGSAQTGQYIKATGMDWKELLQERTDRANALREQLAAEDGGDGGGGGGGGGAGIQLPDPLQIKSLANQIAQLLYGHTLGDDQLNTLVERVNAGAVGADAANMNFDVESNLAAWLRQDDPTQTASHDLANVYSTFTGLIGGIGNAAQRGGTAQGITVT